MHLLDRVADVLGCMQAVVNQNATNDEDAFLGLYLAAHIARERSSARLDVPRCQHGGKRALQSSCGGSDHIVKRGGARFFHRGGI